VIRVGLHRERRIRERRIRERRNREQRHPQRGLRHRRRRITIPDMFDGLARFAPPAPWERETTPDDPRVGHLLGRSLRDGVTPRVALLGFPCDEGVRRNGGRYGAAGGPDALRSALYSLTPDARAPEAFTELVAHTIDLGDLELGGSLEEDQALLGAVVSRLLEDGTFPVIVGGGHETSFGHFLGYAGAERPVEILNIDAHPDVRELREGKAHSGSPFRQALTHPSGLCTSYSVAGLQPHSVAHEHLNFIEQHGGRYIWADELATCDLAGLFGNSDREMLVTFDLDAVERAAAPGTSAPASGGLTPSRWLQLARLAGSTSRVRSVDVVELNPRLDPDGRTVALAALTVWNVLSGLAVRT
jgi:formiminoglutamase